VGRFGLALKSLAGILFGGGLPAEVAVAYGFVKEEKKPAAEKASDGAVQILALLEHDSRLVDFLMEDISGYADAQVGAAVRPLHEACQAALKRHLALEPVIDGVEGTFIKPASAGVEASDETAVRFVGRVPPGGRPQGGILRHKGWRVKRVDLPARGPGWSASILAPAELEVE